MATTLEVIRRVTVEAKERGITELDAKLQKLEKQYQDVSAAGATTAKSTESAERAFTRHSRAVDENLRAMDRFTAQAKAFADARAQGRIGEAEHLRLLTLSEQQMRKTTGANDNFAKSTTQMANSQKLARYEMINLGRQVHDVGVSLASGQNALTVFIQQGSQIADVFATSNISLRNFAAQIGPMALKWGPLALGITAVATALYAVNRALDQQLEARQALGGGPGRFLRETPESIAQAARRTAGAGDVSVGEAREGILGGIRAGGPSLDAIEKAQTIARRYATTIDTDLKPAQEELNKIIGDRTTASFEAAAKSLRVYDADVVRNIQGLLNQGKFAEAANLKISQLTKGIVEAKDATSVWQKFIKGVSNDLDELSTVGNKLTAARTPQQIAQKRLEDLQREQEAGGFAGGLFGTRRTRAPTDLGISFAQEDVRFSERGRVDTERGGAQAKRDAEAAAEKKRIADAVKLLNQEYANQVAVLNALSPAEQAAAVTRQTLFELTKGAAASEEQLTKARNAGRMVLAQSAAETQKAVAAMQVEIGMFNQRAAAEAQQGLAGVAARASVAEEMRLRAANNGLLTQEDANRARLVGTLAEHAQKLRDISQAQDIRASGRDQIELIKLETSLITANAIERERRLAIFKGEIEARALERQGLQASADATREMTRAIANQTANRDRQIAMIEQLKEAWENYYRVIRENEAALISQGRDPGTAKIPMHTQGGTTRGGDWQQFQSGVTSVMNAIVMAAAEAAYGAGNFTPYATGGYSATGKSQIGIGIQPDYAKIDALNAQRTEARKGAENQALQRALSLSMSSLDKQIDALRKTVTDTTQAESDAKAKTEAAEQKRQQIISNYLAAGPSPFEQNADIFYDPAKRLLFAEKIAGSTAQLVDETQANAKANNDAAQAQIARLEQQREQLQEQSELLSSGVQLQQDELAAMLSLIGVVRNELPANLANVFNRQLAGAVQQSTATVQQNAAISTGIGSAPSASTPLLQQLGGLTGAAAYYTAEPRRQSLGSFQHGGEFTVPGSGMSDRPFNISLTPGERVSVSPPGKATKTGTTIERLIVQLPPAADPNVYMNKTSRASFARGARRMGRAI